MKKCPKCHAVIQENARFCLYCMTSFEEKEIIAEKKATRKQLISIICAILISTLCVSSIFIFKKANNLFNNSNIVNSDSQTDSSNHSDTDDNFLDTENHANNNFNNTNDPYNYNNGNNSQGTLNSQNSDDDDNSNNSDNNSDNNSNNTSNDSSNDSSDKTTETPKTENVGYYYRDAVATDDFAQSESITANAVVITGVKTVSANGVYEIPATINGKNVVAICESAFCADNVRLTVKKVIIPATVKTIRAYAFYKCYNLTDIYIKGNAVGCTAAFLPEKSKRNYTITLHASKTCHDREYTTYKSLCEVYWGIQYQEWNG